MRLEVFVLLVSTADLAKFRSMSLQRFSDPAWRTGVEQTMDREPRLTYLPDETVSSLVARQHKLWGSSTFRATAGALFDDQFYRPRHDFPRALDALAACMVGAAGTAVEAIEQHTLMRYYAPFRSIDVVGRAMQWMRQPRGVPSKVGADLVPVHIWSAHPLKACAICMRESLDQFGWTYWRLELQFPGVWVCLRHRQPLMVQRAPWKIGMPKGALPAFDWLSRSWAVSLSDSEVDRLCDLVILTGKCLQMAQQLSGEFFCRISPILINKMKENGWVCSHSGRVRLRDAERNWQQHWRTIRAAPDLDFVGTTNYTATKYFRGSISRFETERIHPLQLVLMIDWLFGNFHSFAEATTAKSDPMQRVRLHWEKTRA